MDWEPVRTQARDEPVSAVGSGHEKGVDSYVCSLFILSICGQKFARLRMTMYFLMSGKSHKRVDSSSGTVGGRRPPPRAAAAVESALLPGVFKAYSAPQLSCVLLAPRPPPPPGPLQPHGWTACQAFVAARSGARAAKTRGALTLAGCAPLLAVLQAAHARLPGARGGSPSLPGAAPRE